MSLSAIQNASLTSLAFGLGVTLLTVFASAAIPERWQQIGFYVGVVLVLVSAPVYLTHSPFGRTLAIQGWPKPITVIFGVLFLIAAGWWLLSALQTAGTRPIEWTFDGFIAGSKRPGVQAHAAKFWTQGVNKSDRFVLLEDAYISSRSTGRKNEMEISTNISGDNNYVSPSAHEPIPPGATVYAHSLFYDPVNPHSEFGLEGMPEDIFLEKFGGFDFVVKYKDGMSFTKTFTIDEIKEQFRAHDVTP